MTWQRADWLNRMSVANKQDFARLQGFRFLFTHVMARFTYPPLCQLHAKCFEDRLAKSL